MKIENNGINPLSTNRPDTTNRVEKKDTSMSAHSVASGADKAEMSENARLLAKARATLGSLDETESERFVLLKQQVQSGDYTVQVSELARKLVAKLYPK